MKYGMKIAWTKGKRRPNRSAAWIFDDDSYQEKNLREDVRAVKGFAKSICNQHLLVDLDIYVAMTYDGWSESKASDIVVYAIARCNDKDAKGDWILIEVSELHALIHLMQ